MSCKVVIDLDGVVLDTHKTLEDKVRTTYPDFRMSNVLTYDFNKTAKLRNVECDLGADRDHVFKVLLDPELYNDVKPYNCAKKIQDLDGLVDVVFHSLSKNQDMADRKGRLIEGLFPNLDYKYEVSLGFDKSTIDGANFVIEDNPHNLEGYLGRSICYLIDKPFNSEKHNPELEKVFNHNSVIRVPDVSVAVSMIVNFVNTFKSINGGR